MITAIGVSLFLENLFQNRDVFGATPRVLPQLLQIRPVLSIAVGTAKSPVVVTNLDLISMGLCVAMMAGLSWFVLRTTNGTGAAGGFVPGRYGFAHGD